jgi:hypothetical protein
VFEVGGVVRARGQHRHRRIRDPGRGDAAQILQQNVGVMIHRCDTVRGEQLREQAHHHFAIFEHIRHARRHPQVVLEHAKLAGVVANDVDAGNVGIDAPRDIHALHLRPVLIVAEHLLGGYDARLQDFLVVIDVMDEGIQRAHALLQSGFELQPLV